MHAGYIYMCIAELCRIDRELGIDTIKASGRRRRRGGARTAGERQHQNRKLLDQEMKSVNKRTTSSARTKSLGA